MGRSLHPGISHCCSADNGVFCSSPRFNVDVCVYYGGGYLSQWNFAINGHFLDVSVSDRTIDAAANQKTFMYHFLTATVSVRLNDALLLIGTLDQKTEELFLHQ